MAKSSEASRLISKNFYSAVDLRDTNWTTNFLNGNFTTTVRAAAMYFRPHSPLGGKTPIEFTSEHFAKAPFWMKPRPHTTKQRNELESKLCKLSAYRRDLRMAKLAMKSKT